jgi:tetratricopeptide (TPR) repeat protein
MAHLSRGFIYFGKKDYYHAITDFTEAIYFVQYSAEAYYLRSIAYTWTGEFIKAIQDWERVLIINPDYQEAKDALLEIRGW